MIKVIIFDYGGVVTGGKYEQVGSKSEQFGLYDLCKKFSKVIKKPASIIYSVFDRRWNSWKIDKIDLRDVFKHMKKRFDLDQKQINKLKEIMFNYSRLNKKMVRLIRRLKKNYKVICFTNHGREWFSNDKKRFMLDNLFDRIFTSYELKIAKPHKRAYLKVLKSLKVKPKEVVYIDDLKRNIKAAKALKMNSFLFKGNLNKFKKYLKRLDVKV